MVKQQVVLWFVFTVLIALLPMCFDYWIRIQTQGKPTWEDFLNDGQILLIAIALGAGSIGDIFSLGKNLNTVEIVVIGTCFITTLFSGGLYTIISHLKRTSDFKDPSLLLRTLIILFALSLLTSILCKWITVSEINSIQNS